MRFYLACIAIFALMLFALRSCGAQEYMSVVQVSLHNGKGGEARGKRLHRHSYGWILPRLRRNALSAAVPLSHRQDTGGTTMGLGSRFAVDTPEPARSPQQIIDDAFMDIRGQ